MTTFANGESGLSVRTKINNVLQHMDGTAGELVINEAGADVDFRVESDTNASALFVDGATGNVGIGITPGVRLHAYQFFGGTTARLQTGTTANGNFLDFYNAASARQGLVGFIDSTNLYIHNDDAAAIIFDTNSTERLRIDASGNVGIGTSNPAAKLHIVQTDPAIRLTRTTDFFYGLLSADGFSAYTNTNDNAPIIFKTANNERARIDGAGNLLIGTTSSGGSKLRISGLPTSSAGLSAGDVWNDGGTLKIA